MSLALTPFGPLQKAELQFAETTVSPSNKGKFSTTTIIIIVLVSLAAGAALHYRYTKSHQSNKTGDN